MANPFGGRAGGLFGNRYGIDNLNIGLLALALVSGVITAFFRPWYIRIIPFLFLVPALLRMFSRNGEKRQKENEWFASWWSPIVVKLRRKKQQSADVYYNYYTCPECKTTLRVPKGRGKIDVHCPRCNATFRRKT